jgi:hypothetical protein
LRNKKTSKYAPGRAWVERVKVIFKMTVIRKHIKSSINYLLSFRMFGCIHCNYNIISFQKLQKCMIVPPSVHPRVRTGFGKFWKLIMDFSRTFKVLEN